MKKILSVSILAVLAVAPLSARAEVIAVPGLSTASANDADKTAIASTAYVKGAYDALQAPVKNIRDAMDVENLTPQTEQEIAAGKQGHYISAGTGVAGNLKALDDAARAHQDKIGSTTLTTTAQTLTGAIEELKSSLGSSDDDSKVSSGKVYVKEDNTVGENLDALDDAIGQVSNLANGSHLSASLNAQGGLVTTVSQNLVNLDTAIRAETSARETAIGTVTNSTTLDASESVGENLDTLATHVETLETNTKVLTTDLPSTGTNYITATADAAANLVTLNAQLRTVTDNLATANTNATVTAGHYIGTSNANNKVGTALTSLDNQVFANTNHIGNATNGLTGTNATGVTDLVTAINNVDNKVLTVYSDWNGGLAPQDTSTIGLTNGFANSNPATTPTPGV